MKKIAVIGNYEPRQCGIATFTADLCEAIVCSCLDIECMAIAVTDVNAKYAYPARVKFEIQEEDLQTYISASKYLNGEDVDVILFQHEYGIYGGDSGNYALALLRNLKMPILSVLHTVLEKPNQEQRNVLKQILIISTHIVVMSQKSVDILHKFYDFNGSNITVIPHGIPDIQAKTQGQLKSKNGWLNKKILMTFGLLSVDKGIENGISAMPKILESDIDVIYLVLGVTHPKVKAHSGESYRRHLTDLAEQLGVSENVHFLNQYSDLHSLVSSLLISDIYLAPYLKREQSVSGTLAYALGTGKAIISTPSLYAEEVLSNGRGLLVPFNNPEALAEGVIYLLKNHSFRKNIERKAYEWSRNNIWSNVAERYIKIIFEVGH